MLPLTGLLGQSKINVPWDVSIADAQLSGEILRCARMLVCHGFLRLPRACWDVDQRTSCRWMPMVARTVPFAEFGIIQYLGYCAFSKSLSHSNSSAYSEHVTTSNSALKAAAVEVRVVSSVSVCFCSRRVPSSSRRELLSGIVSHTMTIRRKNSPMTIVPVTGHTHLTVRHKEA
jgi:hypothetical protein